jgi:hypothetical protein
VIRVPPDLAADLADAVNAERAARAAARAAVRKQNGLLAQLREKRVPLTAVAIYVARALGEGASTTVRGRLAALFRQRTLRDRRHADQREVSPQADSASLPLVDGKEATMAEKPKLVKRVITEETYEAVDPEIDADEEIEDDEPENDDESDDDEPSRKKRR